MIVIHRGPRVLRSVIKSSPWRACVKIEVVTARQRRESNFPSGSGAVAPYMSANVFRHARRDNLAVDEWLPVRATRTVGARSRALVWMLALVPFRSRFDNRYNSG